MYHSAGTRDSVGLGARQGSATLKHPRDSVWHQPMVSSGMRMTWLGLLCAGCAVITSAPPSRPADRRPVAAPAASRHTDAPRPAASEAPSPDHSTQPVHWLVDQRTLFWLVPDRGGAPRCASFVVHSYGVAGQGMLRPAEPEDAAPTATARLPAGAAIQPPTDPYRRVEFAFERKSDMLTLHTPRGLLRRQWLVLSGCRATYPLSALPWFASERACQAARDRVPPMDFAACSGVVHSFPFDQHGEYRGAKWFSRLMATGGQAIELAKRGGQYQCVAWRFRPHGGSGQGTMTSRFSAGSRTTVTSYDYHCGDHQVILLGPSHQSFENGREVSSLAYGCGESYYLRHIGPQHATVGGAHWFPTAYHCSSATSVRPHHRSEPLCNTQKPASRPSAGRP